MIIFRSFMTAFMAALMLSLNGCKAAILNPKGLIALDEKHLLITAVLLMLIIVLPVILLTWFVAWRYRESNTKAVYSPDWSHSTALEIVWWSVPCIIISILATITWISSHRLDPYRPLDSQQKPLTIQAIALDWKWLFIYPDQGIATVNYVKIPVNKPVQFLITADAPMNSFAIPQLAGQIYAMAGMQTKLNLIANHEGHYRGLSTNFSGDGFSNMRFTVSVTSAEKFTNWVTLSQQATQKLTLATYQKLAEPSENNPVAHYTLVDKNLFSTVVMNYMMPMSEMPNMIPNHEQATAANNNLALKAVNETAGSDVSSATH